MTQPDENAEARRRLEKLLKQDETEVLTPVEMADWLKREARDITKSAQLRLQDATDFVAGYLTGTLSPQEADERWTTYNRRWGEPIPGFNVSPEMSDQEILRRLDEPPKPNHGFGQKVTGRDEPRPGPRR
jgi:hypothetical protein